MSTETTTTTLGKRKAEEIGLKDAIDQVNDLMRKFKKEKPLSGKSLFVCEECDRLMLARAYQLHTTDDGQTGLFCAPCIKHCDGCGEDYAPPMYWWHEDHATGESSSEEEEEEEDDKKEDEE